MTSPRRAGPAPDDLPRLRRALLAHYDANARDLPWRGEEDPYRIWVSEVMLQQTRVSTVLGYYDRWLERFPDVDTLAEAELDEVLLAWEGLGYYRRARFLHAGARLVREELDGQVPSTYEGLREIPGLGEYAAGAVASIAFGRRVPAVDGNVRRVLARLFDEPSPGRGWLRERAAGLVDAGRPGDWNQALMELGATVCTPSAPECPRCPLAPWCGARAAGTQEERPAPAKSRQVPRRTFATAVVVDDEGRALVVRRPPQGLLAGLWTFPDTAMEGWDDVLDAAREAAREAGARVETETAEGEVDGDPAGPGTADPGGAGQPARAATDPDGRLPVTLAPVRHRFSHLAATYRPVVLAGVGEDGRDRRWVELDEPGVALPVAQQKIARASLAVLRRGGSGHRQEGPPELI